MSQNMRATPWDSPRQGSTWNVAGSGMASMSASETRAKPSIAEPSKPMPSEKALSSSAGATATDLRKPSTSVNHSRTKRMSRSSSVRSTNSVCLSMGDILPHPEPSASPTARRAPTPTPHPHPHPTPRTAPHRTPPHATPRTPHPGAST